MLCKTKKPLLALLIICNLSFGINFLLLEALSGSFIFFLATIQAIVVFAFSTKEKPLPRSIIAVFVLLALAIGFYTYAGPHSILPIICSIVNMAATVISARSMPKFRKLAFTNNTLWIIHNIIVGALAALAMQSVALILVIVAIIRYDLLKKQEPQP